MSVCVACIGMAQPPITSSVPSPLTQQTNDPVGAIIHYKPADEGSAPLLASIATEEAAEETSGSNGGLVGV